MKLYQAGPMRGYDLYNYQEFEDGHSYLMWLGHEVTSPHRLDIAQGFTKQKFNWYENERGQWQMEFESVELTDKFTGEAAMRIDIPVILASDAITLLEGWEQSTGCANEIAVAKMIGLPIFVHKPWSYFREADPIELSLRLKVSA